MKECIRALFVLVVCVSATLLPRTSKAELFSESQTFDTEAAAVIGGWIGFNTGLGGNDYGFSNTDFTGGTSPAGEAGGTIARTADRSYYGDITLNGVLTLDDMLTASGEFNFIEQAFNNNIQIGHFDPTQTLLVNTLGISVSEAHNPAKDFNITAFISLSDGTHLFSPELLISGINVARTWSYTWDPEAGPAGMLTVSISGPDGGTVVLSLTPAEREKGASFSAFGLSSGSIGEANANNAARLFIDNVSYTIANELAQCEAALAEVLADSDHDGRRDLDDACPNTELGVEVDQAGCSLAQFCVAIAATTSQGEKTCQASDWQNDEPLMTPRDADCTVEKGGPGRADDHCVPRL